MQINVKKRSTVSKNQNMAVCGMYNLYNIRSLNMSQLSQEGNYVLSVLSH